MHRAAPPTAASDRALIDALSMPAAFAHPAASVEVLETHISWVILAGDYAYKVKKALQLPFLDFSTLERRKHFCEEELRLNQPAAPEIYVDVVPIVMVDGRPRFGGDGPAIEYAVRMRRFDQRLRLDMQLEQGLLTIDDMRELGEAVAERHRLAPRIDARHKRRQVETTQRFIRDNFAVLEGRVDEQQTAPLLAWSELQLDQLAPLLPQRFDAGFVRDCHGDLHLANLVRLPTGIKTFDCIEFDPDLRAIDVFADVGFLVMDLVARGSAALAARFLNRYLECTGDYAGVALLDLFFVYRCLVRAKVAAIAADELPDGPERRSELAEMRRYCDIALRQTRKQPPRLLLMHGLAGAGKTWLSGELLSRLPAIRVRSDIERKRQHGLDEHADSRSGVAAGIYRPEASAAVYATMLEHAKTMLRHEHNVILDAAFLGRDEREAALQLARDLGVSVTIIRVQADTDELRRRIDRRAATGGDASEAGYTVLDYQLETVEPLTAEELHYCVDCDSGQPGIVEAVLDALRDRDREPNGEERWA